MQMSPKLAVTARPALTFTLLEPHQPVTLYDPGGTEKRYLVPDRMVTDVTTLDPETRLTFTWEVSSGGGTLPTQASA